MPAMNPTPAPHLTILPTIHHLATRSSTSDPSDSDANPVAGGISNTAIVGIVASLILVLGLLTCCAKVGFTSRRKRLAAEKAEKREVRILGTGSKRGYAAHVAARSLNPDGFVANHHRETVEFRDLRPEALRT